MTGQGEFQVEVQEGGGFSIAQFSDLANGVASLPPGRYRVAVQAEGRPKVIEIIDGSRFGPFFDHDVRIFDRPVKQRFECSSCEERKCAIEIEDSEEIKQLVKLPCLYCGEEVAEVDFHRVSPDPASFELEVPFCECFAGKRTGFKICAECNNGSKYEDDPKPTAFHDLKEVRLQGDQQGGN